MPTVVDRRQLLGLLEGSDAQLVEVLPRAEYDEEHPVRAHEPLVPLLERMARRQVDDLIVTAPEGE